MRTIEFWLICSIALFVVKVLGHIEKAGRHFDMQIDETLVEK